MPITPERKNPLVAARSFRQTVTNRTGINDFDTDSKTDSLIQVFVEEVITNRNETITAFYSNQISNAVGDGLDEIGRDMGLPRDGELHGKVVRQDQNLAFYVGGGTFGSINGGADIVIPAGAVRVYSDPDQNELGAEVSYTNTQQITLPAAGTVAFFGATCTASGPIGNVGAGMLKNHNFTSYLSGSGLEVTNFYSVLNGRPREKDRNYRFRLSRHYDTLLSSNYTKLHLTALRVPGVLDTRVIPGLYGIGTVGVVILGPENQSTPALVRATQARLSDIMGPGNSARASAATAVYFDMALEVKTLRPLSGSEKRQVDATVRRAIRNFMRSQGLGSNISLLAVAREAQSYVGGQVQLLSSGSTTDIFDTVYIRKGPSGGLSTERDLLVNDSYTLQLEEFADLGTLSITYV